MSVLFFSSFACALGAIMGSFLNVVIRRGYREQSFGGRSHCETCKKELSVKELIPIFSFLIQKGRCRFCGAVLSWQYPLVEFSTGIAYAIAARLLLPRDIFQITFLDSVYLLSAFVGIAAAIVVLVSDIRYQIIPNGSALTLIIVGITASILRVASSASPYTMLWDAGGAAAASLILWSLWRVSRGTWIGLGDVKLIFATSLIVGFTRAIPAFFFAFWIGGLIGILLLLFRRATPKTSIPFGPFILAGAFAALCTARFIPDLFLLQLF